MSKRQGTVVDADPVSKRTRSSDTARDVEPRPVQQQERVPTVEQQAIEDQKAMAKYKLALVQTLTHNQRSLIDQVLDSGEVPPIFHALVVPDDLRTRRTKQPTCDSVVAVEGEDWAGQEMELEFDATNMEQVVHDEKPFKMLIDGGIGSWKYNVRAANFAAALVNTPAQMLGHGVEATALSDPKVILLGPSGSHLITRPLSRGVVADCFLRNAEEPLEGVYSAMTGSPGIGKTWTLLYALQQALLFDDVYVLFFPQKGKKAFFFVRRNNKIYAWWKEHTGSAYSRLFDRHEVLVLLDPAETGATFAQASQKLIFAASNNEEHFVNGADKASAGIMRFIGPWTRSEFMVALPFLVREVPSEEVLDERAKTVGWLPRYLILEQRFVDRDAKVHTAVHTIKNNPAALIDALRMEDMQGSHKTLQGTLFASNALIRRDNNEQDIGPEYDGAHVDYGNRVITVLTEKVSEFLIGASRNLVLSFLGRVSNASMVEMGDQFEKLAISDLKEIHVRMREYKMSDIPPKERTQSFFVLDEARDIATISSTMQDAYNEINSKVFRQTNFFAVPPKGFGLIDAAGPGRMVYQITASNDHKASFNAAKMLLLGARLLTDDGKLQLSHRKGVPDDSFISFYWVVPPGRFGDWSKKAAKGVSGKNNSHDWKVVSECWKRHVVQYCLEIPYG
jgi:phosphoribosylanthranilate isomerase